MTSRSATTRTTVAEELALCRAGLVRLTPAQALAATGGGALMVDTRPEFQRRAGGEVPGALVVERNHLEWRLDPASPSRIPEATGPDVFWIVLCDEGYSSSLAAAGLRRLGLHLATDVIGGFQRWRRDGLPVARPAVPRRPRLWPDGLAGTPEEPAPGVGDRPTSAQHLLGEHVGGLPGPLQAGPRVGG